MSDGPVERREPIDSTAESMESAVTHVNHGPSVDATDLVFQRLRVVGKDAALVNLNVASAGDLAIGVDAEDEESTVYPAPGGLKFYVITWRSNFACGYGEQQGQWDEGDPTMPACAKKQYHFTVFVPDYDRIMPVIYTANGAAAKVFRNVITSIVRHGITEPYKLAFEMTTKTYTGNPGGNGIKSWPGPVVAVVGNARDEDRGQADPEEVKIAEGLYNQIVGAPRTAIGSGSSTPTF